MLQQKTTYKIITEYWSTATWHKGQSVFLWTPTICKSETRLVQVKFYVKKFEWLYFQYPLKTKFSLCQSYSTCGIYFKKLKMGTSPWRLCLLWDQSMAFKAWRVK